MFSTISRVISHAVSPKFYAAQFAGVVAQTRKELNQNSAAPLFKFMLLVGLTGYAIEYSQAGRYHVAERQAIIKDAMKHHKH